MATPPPICVNFVYYKIVVILPVTVLFSCNFPSHLQLLIIISHEYDFNTTFPLLVFLISTFPLISTLTINSYFPIFSILATLIKYISTLVINGTFPYSQ